MEANSMGNGYEGIYTAIRPKLSGFDIAGNGVRLGGEPIDGGVRVAFLGRYYIITEDGVAPEDGLPADVNSRSVLIYYITSKGSGDFLYDFALLHRLTGMPDGHATPHTAFMIDPLVSEFGGDVSGFARAMESLGGWEVPALGAGKRAWQLCPLPKILSQIVFYEADDEFPADIQIMFDRTAPRFLDFECLAVMTGAMTRAIIGAGRGSGG
jgi:hypothetical protein